MATHTSLYNIYIVYYTGSVNAVYGIPYRNNSNSTLTFFDTHTNITYTYTYTPRHIHTNLLTYTLTHKRIYTHTYIITYTTKLAHTCVCVEDYRGKLPSHGDNAPKKYS